MIAKTFLFEFFAWAERSFLKIFIFPWVMRVFFSLLIKRTCSSFISITTEFWGFFSKCPNYKPAYYVYDSTVGVQQLLCVMLNVRLPPARSYLHNKHAKCMSEVTRSVLAHGSGLITEMKNYTQPQWMINWPSYDILKRVMECPVRNYHTTLKINLYLNATANGFFAWNMCWMEKSNSSKLSWVLFTSSISHLLLAHGS